MKLVDDNSDGSMNPEPIIKTGEQLAEYWDEFLEREMKWEEASQDLVIALVTYCFSLEKRIQELEEQKDDNALRERWRRNHN